MVKRVLERTENFVGKEKMLVTSILSFLTTFSKDFSPRVVGGKIFNSFTIGRRHRVVSKSGDNAVNGDKLTTA